MSLYNHKYNYYFTPKTTREAPVKVAEWPPLGAGGTPSIYGKAQSHFLSTTIFII
jgi:hypothetical protein